MTLRNPTLEHRVWEVVRHRPSRAGIPYYEVVETVLRDHVATEQKPTPLRGEVLAAIDYLVTKGHLYWRDPRVPRRLLHGPEPTRPTAPAVGGGEQLDLLNPTPDMGGA